MGNICCGEKEIRLILVGIDLAGKTTVLNQLRYKETKTTTPTVGFNFETVIYKKFSMSICDTGGQDRIRDLWKHYFEQVQVLAQMLNLALMHCYVCNRYCGHCRFVIV